jgi:hypothetical protein
VPIDTRTHSVVAVGNYQAPDVVALRLRMLPILRSDNVSAAFLLDGCNCWRIWHGADTFGRFSHDLLDQRYDRAPNPRVFDSSVCPYQRDPIGSGEKSTYVTRYCRLTFELFAKVGDG